jgi:adenosylcobinamide-phosphate synthase
MLTGLGLSLLAWLLAAGVALDWILGEARRWHPLVGFGNAAHAVERGFNRGGSRHARGMFAWALVVLPPVAAAWWLIVLAGSIHPLLAAALHAVLLYFCIGLRSLHDHLMPIQQALLDGDLPRARVLTSRIVSRNTANASSSDIAKAAVESALENGNDAVFGTLFWFVIAGGPGALLFRLANTLDAMWGYRNDRFHAFGWMAARTDDVLNWLPARLTALSYALLGDTRCARECWKTQAPAWSSPNAGPVMSAGAGALRLALGGHAEYDGVVELRPPLGSGRAAQAGDIRRAWRLVLNTCVLWLAILALAAFILERIMHA